MHCCGSTRHVVDDHVVEAVGVDGALDASVVRTAVLEVEHAQDGVTYARQRAAALPAGPEPEMQLKANVANMMALGEALNEASEFGINSNTLKKDDRAWSFWETICKRMDTSPLRTPEEVRNNPERQSFLLAILMMYASAVCVPKTTGRQCIKPRSALAYPLAIIRIFGRWGIPMPGFRHIKAALHGLMRQYLLYHGPHSLQPKRAEPMRFSPPLECQSGVKRLR